MDLIMWHQPGFHLEPTDKEVLNYFFPRIIRGEPTLIQERDVYGDKLPWDILEEFGETESFWVFTRLKKAIKKNGRKGRVSRLVDGGRWCWHAENTKEISDDGRVIGLKRTYTFKCKKSDKKGCKNNSKEKIRDSWKMYEYSSTQDSDYVVCKIKRDVSKKDKDQEEVTARASSAGHLRGRVEEMIKMAQQEFPFGSQNWMMDSGDPSRLEMDHGNTERMLNDSILFGDHQLMLKADKEDPDRNAPTTSDSKSITDCSDLSNVMDKDDDDEDFIKRLLNDPELDKLAKSFMDDMYMTI